MVIVTSWISIFSFFDLYGMLKRPCIPLFGIFHYVFRHPKYFFRANFEVEGQIGNFSCTATSRKILREEISSLVNCKKSILGVLYWTVTFLTSTLWHIDPPNPRFTRFLGEVQFFFSGLAAEPTYQPPVRDSNPDTPLAAVYPSA